MPKTFNRRLASETSEKIYEQILNIGSTNTRKCGNKGKLNKRPAFAQNKIIEADSDQVSLRYYNFHYNSPRSAGRADYVDEEYKKQAGPSPCPSMLDNESDSMIKMRKIRATSAYAGNPEIYRNSDFYLSSTPQERRNQTSKTVPWNQSYQALRFQKGWNSKVSSRAAKRASEIVKHRTDVLYMLTGSAVKLQSKYNVPDGETEHLKELSRARQELKSELREAKEIHNKSRNLSALSYRSKSSRKKSAPLKSTHPVQKEETVILPDIISLKKNDVIVNESVSHDQDNSDEKDERKNSYSYLTTTPVLDGEEELIYTNNPWMEENLNENCNLTIESLNNNEGQVIDEMKQLSTHDKSEDIEENELTLQYYSKQVNDSDSCDSEFSLEMFINPHAGYAPDEDN